LQNGGFVGIISSADRVPALNVTIRQLTQANERGGSWLAPRRGAAPINGEPSTLPDLIRAP